MTPSPITAAAARSKREAADPPESRARTKRRLGQPSGPRVLRRISGPVSGRGQSGRGGPSESAGRLGRSAAAAVAARAEPAPMPAQRPATRPRIAPGPAPAPRTKRKAAPQPIGVRLTASLRGLPDHALLDRLVRGRAWIPLLGVLLAGIVASQVAVLKMSASIGRSIAYSSQLQVRNEQLRATIASLADAQRIQRLAEGMGMVIPHADMVGFLSALPIGALQQATGSIHAPDQTNFLYSAANYGSTGTGTNGSVVTLAGLQAALAANTGSGVSPSLGAGVNAGGGTAASTAGTTAGGGTAASTPATTAGANTGSPSQTAQAGAPGTGTTVPAGGGTPAGTTSGGTPGGTPSGGTPAGTPSGGSPSGGGGVGLAGGTQSGGTSTQPTGPASTPQAGTQTPGG